MKAPTGDCITFINGPFGWRIPRYPRHDSFVYLIHFDEPYKHARHYLGSTGNLDVRLQLHRNGNGARLMEVIGEAGISWQVSRLWRSDTREQAHLLERKLKRQHDGVRLCPICQHRTIDLLVLLRQGKRPFEQMAQMRRRQPMGEVRSPMFVRRVDKMISESEPSYEPYNNAYPL